MKRGAFIKGICDNIVAYTCRSYQIVTNTSREKDVRYFSNLINFEILVLNNKSDNRNVGRIISSALANQSLLLPSNILETEESRKILFHIFYCCMRKRLESSIKQWIDTNGNVELYLHKYLPTLNVSESALTAFRGLPASLVNLTPITESFHNIVESVFRTLLFVKSDFEDENDMQLLCN